MSKRAPEGLPPVRLDSTFGAGSGVLIARRLAAAFMAMVSSHCRVLSHHPEWRNVFNHVIVSLTTWDAHRKVTIYDLNLALFMNMAAKAVLQPQQ
jgi:hypothetical protein